MLKYGGTRCGDIAGSGSLIVERKDRLWNVWVDASLEKAGLLLIKKTENTSVLGNSGVVTLTVKFECTLLGQNG